MPELPELEVVCEVLNRRLSGREILRVSIEPRGGPIVIRDLGQLGFAQALGGRRVVRFERHGKYLLLRVDRDDLLLVVNFKLTGRFQLAQPGAKKAGPVHVSWHFDSPQEELRYVDRKRMGQLYLTPNTSLVPTFDSMGPDALTVSRDDFRLRLRRFHGEIKGVLAREQFLAGIGNAYADEILWHAQLYPFRKRPGLDDSEIDRLYHAMQTVLRQSIETVRQAMGDEIHLKPRDFFAVHLKAGKPCPRCQAPVSAVTANRRITNFCRSCQPGGLVRGIAD